MRIDTISTFPDMFSSVMGSSMMKRAQEKGILEFCAHDLRDWTHDRHRTTDDSPYGGGMGLVMKCEPIYEAMDDILSVRDPSDLNLDTSVIIMAPQGRVFNDAYAKELSLKKWLIFICGHYEGIDERVYELADDVISLGDYVLTSGELASMIVIDSVVRKLPGVLGAEGGAEEESFSDGLLEFPQYTRPAEYRGMCVPEILLSGHHAQIGDWRRRQSLKRTAELRPDLIDEAKRKGILNSGDIEYLEYLSQCDDMSE